MPSRLGPTAALLLTRAMYAAGFVLLLAAAWRGSERMTVASREAARASLATGVGGRGALLVVFRPEDCTGHATFIRSWQRLAAADSLLPVLGVPLMAGRGEPWVARAIEDLRGEYPQRPEFEAPLREVLAGLPRFQTPAAVLVDRHARVALVIPALSDPRQIRRAHSAVGEYLQMWRMEQPS